MTENTDYIIVLNTCPGSITAKQIAQDLVANDHAACVNIIPGIQSTFKWGNQVKTEQEVLLVIKTTRENYDKVEKRIRSLHPYELPEVIAVPVTNGFEGYLSWIKQAIT